MEGIFTILPCIAGAFYVTRRVGQAMVRLTGVSVNVNIGAPQLSQRS